MRHLPTALAALAVAISAASAWHTRRALQRQAALADFRWKHGRNDIAARLAARKHAEDEHRLGVNGHHPAGGQR